MNDGPLAAMLAELDAELGKLADPAGAARLVLDRVEACAPGAILASAASLQLRALGCSSLVQ